MTDAGGRTLTARVVDVAKELISGSLGFGEEPLVGAIMVCRSVAGAVSTP